MSIRAPHTAEGQEVLVVDADDKVLKGLERLLGEAGLIVTSTPDPVRGRDQIVNKFFAVTLCDIDTPGPGEGLAFARFVREKSPLTTVIMLTPRKAFDSAVAAFRAGAADVILKQPESVTYLKERVVAAAVDIRKSGEKEKILEEVGDVHEDFLRRMMDLGRQVVDLEDRVLGRKGAPADEQPEFLELLVVDDGQEIYPLFEAHLTPAKGWRLRNAQTGGEAMDLATQAKVNVAIVNEHLHDLPGTMVVKAIKSSSPDAIVLLFVPPGEGGKPGEVKMVEASKLFTLIPSFSDPKQLLESLGDVREAFQKKAKERRYLQAFRQQHFEFLKGYNDIKQRIARVVEKKG